MDEETLEIDATKYLFARKNRILEHTKRHYHQIFKSGYEFEGNFLPSDAERATRVLQYQGLEVISRKGTFNSLGKFDEKGIALFSRKKKK